MTSPGLTAGTLGPSIYPEEEEEEEDDEFYLFLQKQQPFVFNDTIEGPRAPAVKSGRVTLSIMMCVCVYYINNVDPWGHGLRKTN